MNGRHVINVDSPSHLMYVVIGLALIGDLEGDSALDHPYTGIFGYLGGEKDVAVNVTRIDATTKEHERGQESTVWSTPLMGVSATVRTPAELADDVMALLNLTFSLPEVWERVAAELPGATLALPPAPIGGNAFALPPVR